MLHVSVSETNEKQGLRIVSFSADARRRRRSVERMLLSISYPCLVGRICLPQQRGKKCLNEADFQRNDNSGCFLQHMAAAATAHRIRPDTQHADGTGNVTVSWVMCKYFNSGFLSANVAYLRTKQQLCLVEKSTPIRPRDVRLSMMVRSLKVHVTATRDTLRKPQ